MKRWMTAIAMAAAAAMLWLAMPRAASADTSEAADLQKMIRMAEQTEPAKPAPKTEPAKDAAQPAESGEAKPADDGSMITGLDDSKKEAAADDLDDLIDALRRKAGGETRAPGVRELLDRVAKHMGDSRDRLRQDYDTGSETQRVQKKIIRDLDVAIAMAQQSSSSSSSSQSQGQKKDKAQSQGKQQGQQPQDGDPQTNRANSPAQREQASHGKVSNVDPNKPIGTTAEEGWGNLPLRDRDEIVQARKEQSLPRWESLIEKYYTALQVQAENKKP
ncbi:MAG: hypothetical protein BIFFINMI_03882 [Phycisphaerae bacterium]|nr:hypothetical protein [Phycisphaerae bacterium]